MNKAYFLFMGYAMMLAMLYFSLIYNESDLVVVVGFCLSVIAQVICFGINAIIDVMERRTK